MEQQQKKPTLKRKHKKHSIQFSFNMWIYANAVFQFYFILEISQHSAFHLVCLFFFQPVFPWIRTKTFFSVFIFSECYQHHNTFFGSQKPEERLYDVTVFNQKWNSIQFSWDFYSNSKIYLFLRLYLPFYSDKNMLHTEFRSNNGNDNKFVELIFRFWNSLILYSV